MWSDPGLPPCHARPGENNGNVVTMSVPRYTCLYRLADVGEHIFNHVFVEDQNDTAVFLFQLFHSFIGGCLCLTSWVQIQTGEETLIIG